MTSVAVVATESATRTVKVEVPATVGVPAITPVPAVKVSPVGRVPTVTVHEPYGGVPPDAESVTLYAVLMVALGSIGGVVICNGTVAGLIVKANVLVAVCGFEQASVTRIWGLNEPDVEGVPATSPAPDRVTPVGSEPPTNDHVLVPVPPALIS